MKPETEDGSSSPSPSTKKTSSHDAGNASPLTPKPPRKLPAWLDHFNARDLKTLLRCSVAFWVASLLIVIEPTLNEFGAATFFGCIVTVFLPPSGVVLVFLLGGMTMILGMALGWAWGVIAMKAALAARSASETAAQLQVLAQTSAATGEPAANLIYQGYMLDTRVTVVWFCLEGLFLYLMARLKEKAPKLTLTCIFAWIISDVFITSGPLLPSFNGTIPAVLIKPAAAALAINVACSILIFPESTSHLALAEFHKLTTIFQAAVPMTAQYLDDPTVTETDGEVQGLKGAIIGCWTAMQSSLGFLSFDFSFGYWGAHDIQTLKDPMKRLLISTNALLDAQLVQHESRQRAKRFAEDSEEVKRPYGQHQIMESLNLLDLLSNEDVQSSVRNSFQSISSSSKPLLASCSAALSAIADSIHTHNSSRRFNTLSPEALKQSHTTHTAALEELRTRTISFHETANSCLLDTHAHLFDASGAFAAPDSDPVARHRLTGLFIGLTMEDRLGRFAEAIEALLAQIQALEAERSVRRLWMPSGPSRFFAWVLGSDPVPSVQSVQPAMIPELDKETKVEMTKRFHDASARPVRRRNLVSKIVLGTAHWLVSDEGIFGARILVATLALGVIAVTRQTAGFFYREKGLWALIMAQTGMVLQFADFSVAVVTRVAGTVAGGVLGMLGWYIGSGVGPGNPYGLGAVLAVVSIAVMWLRLWAPPQFLPQVMIGVATFVLVVGYSYIDTHAPTYGDPGVGYEVFWRRTLLVIVGFAVSLIVSLLPWPTSQSRFVARSLSTVLHTEADHYAILLSSWPTLGTPSHTKLIPAVEGVAIHVSESLSALRGPVGNLRYEFSSSAFDSATCMQILRCTEQINRHLAVMYIVGTQLPEHLRTRFARAAGLLHHDSIASVMAVFSVLEQSLKTGDALPSRLPTPLVKACIAHGHGADIGTLTREMLRDREYRAYTIVMSSYLGFLAKMDEMVLVLKEALGEAYYIPRDLGAGV